MLALALVAAGCGGDEGGGNGEEAEACVDEDIGVRVLSCDQENAIPVSEFERFNSCVDELSGSPAECGTEGTIAADEFKFREQEDEETEAFSKELGQRVEKIHRELRGWAQANPQEAADACFAVEAIESIEDPELAEIADDYMRRSLAPVADAGFTPEEVGGALSNFCDNY